MSTLSTKMEEYNVYVDAQLHDPQVIGEQGVRLLDKVEVQTGVKRLHVVYGAYGLLSLYLMLGSMAGLVCNIVGFAYPCFMSFKAITTVEKDDDTQWLTYWCVFGSFSVLDAFADPIMSVVPIYWLSKCIFMVYLYHPTLLGASHVYKEVVEPLFAKLEMWQAQHAASPATADPTTAQPAAAAPLAISQVGSLGGAAAPPPAVKSRSKNKKHKRSKA